MINIIITYTKLRLYNIYYYTRKLKCCLRIVSYKALVMLPLLLSISPKIFSLHDP